MCLQSSWSLFGPESVSTDTTVLSKDTAASSLNCKSYEVPYLWLRKVWYFTCNDYYLVEETAALAAEYTVLVKYPASEAC